MTSTFNRLNACMVVNYQIASESVTLDSDFASLNMDSLDVAELLFDIEEEFKISFPAQPKPLPTVGDVVRYIDQLIAAQEDRDTQRTLGMEPALQTL